MHVDLPLEELRAFTYRRAAPADFDQFWADTLANQGALDPRWDSVKTGLETVTVQDLTFNGCDGHPVRAWVIRPKNQSGPLPLVVEFVGYGGGRGLPIESLHYSAAGYAHVIMDTRGQGSSWRSGHTPDPVGSGPSIPGFLSRGLDSRDDYYYRRLYVDAVRMYDVAVSLPDVDASLPVVTGRSQGGALALVVGALRPSVALVVPHVPFLCAFERALQVTDSGPFAELTRWFATHRDSADRAMEVLDYFDVVNFARRGTATAHFSVALADVVSPPSTVFAAHNEYGSERTMTVWPHNGHEAGGPLDLMRTIDAMRNLGLAVSQRGRSSTISRDSRGSTKGEHGNR